MGRLIKVTNSTNDEKPDGDFISKVKINEYHYNALDELTGINDKNFSYSGDQVVSKRTKTSNIRYINNLAYEHVEGGEITLLGKDQNGSVIATFDSDKKEINFHNYTPYGYTDPKGLELGYNGELIDGETGLYHLGKGYRAYNPILRRFNCPDGLSPFDGGGINPYAYCNNNPVMYTDPSGAQPGSGGGGGGGGGLNPIGVIFFHIGLNQLYSIMTSAIAHTYNYYMTRYDNRVLVAIHHGRDVVPTTRGANHVNIRELDISAHFYVTHGRRLSASAAMSTFMMSSRIFPDINPPGIVQTYNEESTLFVPNYTLYPVDIALGEIAGAYGGIPPSPLYLSTFRPINTALLTEGLFSSFMLGQRFDTLNLLALPDDDSRSTVEELLTDVLPQIQTRREEQGLPRYTDVYLWNCRGLFPQERMEHPDH
nr:RHS repeat-associated core domain-containing protein [Elizabethkingia sp. ASV34]